MVGDLVCTHSEDRCCYHLGDISKFPQINHLNSSSDSEQPLPIGTINTIFERKSVIIFLLVGLNISFGYSKELSR